MNPGLSLKVDGSKERPKEKVKHVRYNHCNSYYHKALKSDERVTVITTLYYLQNKFTF